MQSRIEALKKAAASRKGHKDAGHGELRSIVEEEFLKEVTSTECVAQTAIQQHPTTRIAHDDACSSSAVT